ncbi:MAG: RpoL/Rpb11 RNA polymerase subunit family protein [Candidatus Micrarchaeaceae archaeon]
MEVTFKKDESKELMIEFDTSDFTLPDLIAARLVKDPGVSFAGVYKEHPETGKPLLVVKTEKKRARELLEKALKELEDEYSETKEELQKKVK